jgi:hypothetical protein
MQRGGAAKIIPSFLLDKRKRVFQTISRFPNQTCTSILLHRESIFIKTLTVYPACSFSKRQYPGFATDPPDELIAVKKTMDVIQPMLLLQFAWYLIALIQSLTLDVKFRIKILNGCMPIYSVLI